MEPKHVSVLLNECIEALCIKPDGIYVDGTLGLGGHSSEIAKRLTTGLLIGIDRDETAIERAGARLAPYGERVRLVHGNFSDVASILDRLGIDAVDGMLFDLGVSSPQLDEAQRGFSYMQDAPLDMRMDGSASLSAHDVVNTWPEGRLRPRPAGETDRNDPRACGDHPLRHARRRAARKAASGQALVSGHPHRSER